MQKEYQKTLISSRCVTFGHATACRELFAADELLACNDATAPRLETVARELLRAIHAALEERRLDVAYERLEHPPCPLLAEEERYRIGTENHQARAYRRKCLGRLRKQTADYALLAGAPQLALDMYASAVDALKAVGDLLWLAGEHRVAVCLIAKA